MDKQDAMALLVAKRRAEAGGRYNHLHLYDGGSWDFDFVVPWTKSACRLDADLMIVGQDWASEDYLRRNDDAEKRADRALTGQDAHLATNQNLKRLLAHFGLCFSQTYATNVLVFIKPGGMSSKVPMKDLYRCAVTYTLPQLDIVKPRMALCLGAMTFDSVRSALGLGRLGWREACIPSAHTRMGPTEIYGVPHTGSWGTKNAGGPLAVEAIWAALARRFHAPSGSAQESFAADRS
ncbi:hypothetical protein IVB38_35280 [Bradyrhizobium sp. 38]|uniref:uracil-DNA glycosylase family protein n=1 Tax=unclassified Bradyrhizobium TaxID=2631580 RepID=UPI001FF9B84D|nr:MULTISPECIES: uracil-DNA glycosylase family protein [unclassified Bradyrhizobium]MCK1341124.1 hypothetical protein [Bradyrhizobium sp. 38]MCK1781214.1 hypothetical protein [Bradyrhizobium sp. 132]